MLNKVLDAIEKYVTALLFAAMCIVIMLQVIFRTINMSASWSEEIARYLFVWVIYLAAGRAMATEKHLTVDILPLFLKGKAKTILHIVSVLLTLAFFIGLLYAGSIVLPNLMVRTQFSPANHINMIVPYAAPTFGTIMMTIRSLQLIVKDIKALVKPSEELQEVTE